MIHITVYNMNGQLYFHLNSTHLMLWEGDVRCARQKKFFNCLNMPIFSGFCNCIYSTWHYSSSWNSLFHFVPTKTLLGNPGALPHVSQMVPSANLLTLIMGPNLVGTSSEAHNRSSHSRDWPQHLLLVDQSTQSLEIAYRAWNSTWACYSLSLFWSAI